MQPDRDLGKAMKPGCGNYVKSEADRERSFGLPTVRSDIPEKKFKKIADF
jgi:hypothetical protein